MTLTICTTPADLATVCAWLDAHPGRLALDTETTGLNIHMPDFVCGAVAFGHASGDALVLEGREPDLVKDALRAAVHGRRVYAHNATYDALVLRRAYEVAVESLRDTLTAAQVAWPGRDGGYSLKALRPTTQEKQDALRALWDRVRPQYVPASGKRAGWLPEAVRHLRVGTTPELAAYVAEDAVETARLADDLARMPYIVPMRQRQEVERVWRWHGWRGIRVDRDRLDASLAELESRMAAAAADLDGVEVWKNTNVRNDWLAQQGFIPPTDPKTGRPTWSRKMRGFVQVPEGQEALWAQVSEAMELAATHGKLAEIRDAADQSTTRDRVYPTIRVITPRGATGRMAISGPALQNLAKRAALVGGGTLRELLLPDEGRVLVGADLAHVEPSMMAALSGDRRMAAACARDRDPYVETAVIAWGSTMAERDATGALTPAAKEGRARAKVILLALMYGMGDSALAAALRSDLAEARRVRQRVLGEWRDVDRWITRVTRTMERGHQQLTWGGRPIPLIRDDRGRPRAYLARNHLIQGSAADLYQQMTLHVAAAMPQSARLWLPVHDELVVECAPEDADETAAVLATHMQATVHGVPIWADTPLTMRERWLKA